MVLHDTDDRPVTSAELRRSAPRPAGRARDLARRVGRAPFTVRAWSEAAYCLLTVPLALVGALTVTVLLALGAGLVVSLVGAALGALLLLTGMALARGLAVVQRGLAARLLGERVAPPPPVRPGRGLLGRLDTRLRDGAGWRAVAYVLLRLVWAALGGYAVAWWISGLLNLTVPLRWAVFGQDPGSQGGEPVPVINPLPLGEVQSVATFPGTGLAVAVGAVTLLVAPWLTRAVVALDRWLVRGLLGPGRLAERVRDLEERRALAVDDSAALLRRLERDLHDGAQVRLVALAMSLDMIREGLDDSGAPVDPARLRHLVDLAHRNAGDALTELRDLSRGLHPPVLDNGLPDALATLAARSALPVELTVDVPRRPTPAIEAIGYFCVAELLTNAIKHGDARRITVEAVGRPDELRLRVRDDGRGGAHPEDGGGLAGLLQRVRTVDGELRVSSPEGGPTEVTVVLPPHA